ncbi:hypothetical protein MTO96_000641 [Rhipicephalus appendiculatus]
MSKQPQNRALGTLVVDEIKLRQCYEFNKSTYKVDGFVDYGGIVKEGTGQLADHALVPMFEGWVQPIASFATKGAAPGRVLAELVLEAVVQLHKYAATVIAVVSDGAGNNKSSLALVVPFQTPDTKFNIRAFLKDSTCTSSVMCPMQ